MRIRFMTLTGAMLLITSSQVSAQQPKSQSEKQACWEMSTPMKELVPFVLILLNKCTGSSWILTRITNSEPNSTTSGSFSYRWVPLDGSGGEAVPGRP